MERIGLSARLKGWSVAEQISLAKELGLNYIEIVAEIFWDLPDNKQLWKELKEIIKKTGIKPILHASYIEINPASIKKEISQAAFKQYAQCLELADYIKANYMVVHPGNLNRNYPEEYLDKATDVLVDGLKILCKKAEEKKLLLGLENGWNGENYPIINSAEKHIEIIDRVATSWLKAVVDVGHVNTFGIDIDKYIEKMNGYLIGFHLHDNSGVLDQHLPLGKGSIDKKIFHVCLTQNVPAILELNSVDDIKASLQFLRELL